MSSKTQNILELKDIFIAHLSNQEDLKEYPKTFIPLRTQLLNWIINICQRLHFKREFFTKNILNVKTNKLYKSSDIYMEEMEILSSINYCINSSTICQFNSIFTKICLLISSMEKANNFSLH